MDPPGNAAGDEQLAFPALDSQQRRDGVRKKVPLAAGHSPLDWAKLQATAGNALRTMGAAPSAAAERPFALQRFTPAQLAAHAAADDCWIALGGKVYNVTAYVPFHPGGRTQLLRGAGKDASELFQRMHSWVNYERILEKCWIGYLVPEGHGTWALPGGHLEMGESFAACAIREVKEETSVAVNPPTLDATVNTPMPEYGKHYVTIFMRTTATNPRAEPVNAEPEKCDGWHWVTWADLADKPLFAPLAQYAAAHNKDPSRHEKPAA